MSAFIIYQNVQAQHNPPQKIPSWYQFTALTLDSMGNMPKFQTPSYYRIKGSYYIDTSTWFIYVWDGSTFRCTNCAPDSTFLSGYGTPSNSLGVNSQKYYDRTHGFYYKKISGSWQFSGILYSDTTYMHDSTLFQAPILKLTQWSPLEMNWNTGAIQRNQNAPGNVGLTNPDDPVFIYGWNTDVNGSAINPSLAQLLWSHESNFKTLPFFNKAFYEVHMSTKFKPGSQAATYFSADNGGARVESYAIGQDTSDVYHFSTVNRHFYQYPLCSGCAYTTFFDMTPTYFGGLKQLRIDSIGQGNAIISFNGVGFLDQLSESGTTDRYVVNNRFGMQDTTTLYHGSSDFYYKMRGGGTGVIRYGGNASYIAVGDIIGGVNQGLYGSQAMSIHNTDINNANIDISQGSGVFGITLNGTPTGKSYLDISSKDLGQYFNMYFRHNSTFIDSVVNGVNWNMEKKVFGSYTSASLPNTFGYQFNLNYINRFAAVFTSLQDASNNYLPKWIFQSRQPGGSTIDTVVHIMPTGAMSLSNNEPVASAKLDISTTTQGFLPPRMTTTQKNAISSPAEGLIVYDLTLHKLCVYTGSAWETITSL